MKKCLVVGIILLFVGTCIIPSTAQYTEQNQRFDTISGPFPPSTWWMKTFGGIWNDCGYSVKQTTDGGYIITGFMNASAWLLKLDGNGDMMWEKYNIGRGWGRCVQQTSDGGYIVLGENAASYIWLLKTDDTGNIEWNTTYNRTDTIEACVVQQTTDGGYFIATTTWSSNYYWLLKTNTTGHLMWEKTFGGSFYDVCYSGQQTIDGGYIITGCTTAFGGSYFKGWLIKTDGNGDMVWNKTFSGTDDVIGKAVQQTSDGGYIIAADFCWGEPRILLIKTDGDGNTLWERILNDDRNDYAKAIQQTTDGGYIIIGRTWYGYGNGTNSDFLLTKTDSEGNTIWARTFDKTYLDEAETGQQTTDGGYILLGTTYDPWGSRSDVWMIKTDEYGYVTTRPNTPTIAGKIDGAINTSYDYTITTTDPDNDDVQYFINWQDATTTLTGFNASGKTLIVPHTWTVKGTYNITVKAIDKNCAESDWATLTVTMPCSYNSRPLLQIFELLFQRFPNAFPLLRQLLGCNQ